MEVVKDFIKGNIFQSHYGSINTEMVMEEIKDCPEFQSHYGSINTDNLFSVVTNNVIFQSHYGSINT